MEGKINFYKNDNATEKQPVFKGYLEIDGVVHQFAAWAAKSGNGWSGTYKPKGDYKKPETRDIPEEAKQGIKTLAASTLLDDEIPF